MSESSIQVPMPLAMVICDGIHRDPGTGKMTILGTFSGIASHEFPTKHPIFCVYCALTDGRGKTQLKFQVIDANEEREPVLSATTEIEQWPDPIAVVELPFTIKNIVFPAPGEYRAQLYANDEILIERRIIVNQIPPA